MLVKSYSVIENISACQNLNKSDAQEEEKM